MPDNIAQAFGKLGARFIVWRKEARNGKPCKTPYSPLSMGRKAKMDDPATWGTLAQAQAAFDTGGYTGIGVVLGDLGDGTWLVGLDLDACLSPETVQLADWARPHLERWRYTWHEVSPSGTGVKALGIYRGALPVDHRCEVTIDAELPQGAEGLGHDHPELGLYSQRRYFALTGNVPEGGPKELVEVTAAFNETLQFLEGESKRPSGGNNGQSNGGKRTINKPPEEINRSKEDFALAHELARQGKTDEEIEEALRTNPNGQMGTGKVTGRLAERQIRRLIFKARASIELGLITNKNGDPIPCLANVQALMSSDGKLVDTFGWNEVTGRVELTKPLPWRDASAGIEWADGDDSACAVYLQRHHRLMVGDPSVARMVDVLAKENKFNPVTEYLDALAWDGVPRLGSMAARYLQSPGVFACRALEAWMVSAVARAYCPGCQADHVPVFESEQGKGKSSFLRILGGEWFTDQIERDVSNRDEKAKLRGAWLVELAELGAMRKSEVETMKAFLTARVDEYRPSYGRRVVQYPRRCVFAATTNPAEEAGYLRDTTGNRRFWPIPVGIIDLDGLAADRDQLWAEAVAFYRSGAKWWFEAQVEAELARPEQEAREEHDDWQDVIRNWVWNESIPEYSDDGKFIGYNLRRRGQPVTVTALNEVAEFALHVQVKEMDLVRQRRIGLALRKVGFVKDTFYKIRSLDDNEKRKWWRLPDEVAAGLKPNDNNTPF